MDNIERAIDEYNQRVYQGGMNAHQKEVLRDMLTKEQRFWSLEAKDFINGYDDGAEKEIAREY